MLLRHRRYFALLAFVLLTTPLVFGVVRPDRPELILKEGRLLAPTPQPPQSWEALSAFPGETDAYLKDHFGLRQTMIRAHRDLSHPLVYGNESVLIGRDGRMFALAKDMVRQSAGLVLRDRKVADAADFLGEMHDAVARRGSRFLVAIPPSASTIYQDDLPVWARNRGRLTEYDLLLTELAVHGVKAIDLRPVVASLEPESRAYLLHDSHWTARAALTAFNAIVEADSHSDWRLDPATSIGAPVVRKGGDIARILGVQDDVVETVQELALPSALKTENISAGPMADYVATSGEPGPTIMVIGDSFTAYNFPPMLLRHAARVVWLNHRQCGFDWKWIDRFRPDEVWWVPTERYLICDDGVRPVNFTVDSSYNVQARDAGLSPD
jgi:hypothetical protein